jgi:2-octaprenyl-6-methoxyphenol hydroxylase
MALIWIDAPEKLSPLQSLSEPAFLQRLAQYLPLDAVYSQKGHSKIYPLQCQLRNERVRPHLVVIGNAAQSLHPIAAQGFNLAVRDIRDFMRIIGNQAPEVMFSGAKMQHFAAQRATDVRKVRGFVDVLNRAFLVRQKTPFLGFLQDAALLGFELIPGAKASLSRFAMGGRSR